MTEAGREGDDMVYVDGAVGAPQSRQTGDDIDSEIANLFARGAQRAEAYGPEFTRLWAIASDCALGGKLLRPKLLIQTFDALGSRPMHRESAVRIAAATELLHFAFLLHDDVIDGDLIRRGRPNFVGTVLHDEHDSEALHLARSSAILIGDLLLADVHQVFAREPLPEPERTALLDLLDTTITDSIVGEYLDIGLCAGAIPSRLHQVLRMTRMKTATYTFELPLRAAAVLAGASSRTADLLGDVGQSLGTAFQLQDDLLSVFGDEHGKDSYSDLREGKETALIAIARAGEHWADIEPNFGSQDLTEEQGHAIRDMLSHCGAESQVRGLVDEHLHLARQSLSECPPALSTTLETLITTMEARRS